MHRTDPNTTISTLRSSVIKVLMLLRQRSPGKQYEHWAAKIPAENCQILATGEKYNPSPNAALNGILEKRKALKSPLSNVNRTIPHFFLVRTNRKGTANRKANSTTIYQHGIL